MDEAERAPASRVSQLIFALLAILVVLAAGCTPTRAEMPDAERYTRMRELGEGNSRVVSDVRDRLIASLREDLAAGRAPSLDILILSGGADWGAFGAGYLHAWSTIPAGDAQAMPAFDLVTGISTGALIAPYAFVGDYARVDDLYRSSHRTWANRSLIFGLFTGHGFYDISILEELIRDDLDRHLRPRLTSGTVRNRSLVVATADMDLGLMRLWDLTAATTDSDRLYQVQRAAIAVPGAFDPIEIDGTLHADAGVMMQLFTTPQPHRLREALDSWRAEHPDHPARLRYWVILNNRIFEPPTTVQPTWHSTIGRSMAMMLKSGLVAPLRSIGMQVESLSRAGHDAQFRWIGIPPDFPIDASLDMFDRRTTQSLSDLGRRLALGPQPWHTDVPVYTGRDVEDGGPPPPTAPAP